MDWTPKQICFSTNEAKPMKENTLLDTTYFCAKMHEKD